MTRPAGPAGTDRNALILPHRKTSPEWGGRPRHLGSRAAVLGRAAIGPRAALGPSSVVRADGHFIRIGADFTLGGRSTVHIAHDLYPTVIGSRVTVGRNSVIHACTVGDDCVIGDDCVVLDGSVLACGVVLEPGSIAFPRSEFIGGQLYAGMPAKPIRTLVRGELEARAEAVRAAGADSDALGSRPATLDAPASVFIAGTARLAGAISAGSHSSIWYGCDVDAGDGRVAVGANVNIQDNTEIRCAPGGRFEIGRNSTVGHNVSLAECRIGCRTLIGIGSRVGAGTVVGDDVFLAAGAETMPGQVLESGWLYGKRPAQKMARLDEAKRALIALTVEQYCGYARAFKEAEEAAIR